MKWKEWREKFAEEGIEILDDDSGFSNDATVSEYSARLELQKCTVRKRLPKQTALTDLTSKLNEKGQQLLAQIGTWQMADGFFAIDVAGVMANVPCKLASSLDTAGKMLAEVDDNIIKILNDDVINSIELYESTNTGISSFVASARDVLGVEQYRGEGPWPLSALLQLLQNYQK